MATVGNREVPAPDGAETEPDASRDLDPADWSEFRRLAHDALDDMITHVETIRQQSCVATAA